MKTLTAIKETLVHIEGIPVWLKPGASVEIREANIKLLSEEVQTSFGVASAFQD